MMRLPSDDVASRGRDGSRWIACAAGEVAAPVRHAGRRVGSDGVIFDALRTRSVLERKVGSPDCGRTLEQLVLRHSLELHASALALTVLLTPEVQRIGGAALRAAFLELSSVLFDGAEVRPDPASLQRVTHIVGAWPADRAIEPPAKWWPEIEHRRVRSTSASDQSRGPVEGSQLVALREAGLVDCATSLDVMAIGEGRVRASVRLRREITWAHKAIIVALESDDISRAAHAHASLASVCDVVVPQWRFVHAAIAWRAGDTFWIPAVVLKWGDAASGGTPLGLIEDEGGMSLSADFDVRGDGVCPSEPSRRFFVDLVPGSVSTFEPTRAVAHGTTGRVSSLGARRRDVLARFEAAVGEVERDMELSLLAASMRDPSTDSNQMADQLWVVRRFLRAGTAPSCTLGMEDTTIAVESLKRRMTGADRDSGL